MIVPAVRTIIVVFAGVVVIAALVVGAILEVATLPVAMLIIVGPLLPVALMLLLLVRPWTLISLDLVSVCLPLAGWHVIFVRVAVFLLAVRTVCFVFALVCVMLSDVATFSAHYHIVLESSACFCRFWSLQCFSVDRFFHGGHLLLFR